MFNLNFRGSGPDRWSSPRPYRDASLRFRAYGALQPMNPEPGLLARMFGAR